MDNKKEINVLQKTLGRIIGIIFFVIFLGIMYWLFINAIYILICLIMQWSYQWRVGLALTIGLGPIIFYCDRLLTAIRNLE